MKVVIVTPAGRKRYLKILFEYLNKQKDSFDTWQLWINTENANDISYCKDIASKHTWIQTYDLIVPFSGNGSINSFFRYAMDTDTIYIRLDDDIVYLEPNFIKKITEARLKYPSPPFIYPLIINNGNICHYLAKQNKFTDNNIDSAPNGLNNLFYNPKSAYEMHCEFIKKIKDKNISHYYTNSFIVNNFYRLSINCISWLGQTIAELNGNIYGDEEQFLSVTYPQYKNNPNMVYGNAICSHYAFISQRDFLDNETNILEQYQSLCYEC
jgi:hypothetical protein